MLDELQLTYTSYNGQNLNSPAVSVIRGSIVFKFLSCKRKDTRFWTVWQQAFPELNLLLISSWIQFWYLNVVILYTRWFEYDRDKLWLVYTQIVPVIFEPPCTSATTSIISFEGLTDELENVRLKNCLIDTQISGYKHKPQSTMYPECFAIRGTFVGNSRVQWPSGQQPAGIPVSNTARIMDVCLSVCLFWEFCFQVLTDRSLVQRSPTNCGVSLDVIYKPW
jgi:hypothetical protein